MKDTLKVIQVVVGDIIHFNVDDIVNAPNNSLLREMEVDGAICRTVEKDLLKYYRTLGGYSTGESKITETYKFLCKKIIHTKLMACISFLKRKIYGRSFTYRYNFLKEYIIYYTYIFYGENLDLYSTGSYGLNELPGIRVRAILQEALKIHYDNIRFL